MLRIMIADESRLHRAIVAAALQESGYEIIEAADGPSALSQVATSYPDMIIVDRLIPGLDGLELCRLLRHDRFTRHIPVLLLTRSDSPSEKARALDIGADSTLPKPFHQQELRAVVDATLRWRHQHDPLTHLPASPLVRNHIEQRLQGADDFAVGLVDVDHFKSYNDYYGHPAGNTVITRLAHIIHSSANGVQERTFVGHLGGDDFIIVCSPQEVEGICSSIHKTFTQECPAFYKPEDRERGYVGTVDRRGDVHRWPLMTLSIAVTTTARPLTDYAQIGDILRELSAFVKSDGGDQYFIDRRTD